MDPRRNIAISFRTQKLKWLSYAMVKTKFEDMFIRFDTFCERVGQTDRQTPHDGIGRTMHSIARQKLTLSLT